MQTPFGKKVECKQNWEYIVVHRGHEGFPTIRCTVLPMIRLLVYCGLYQGPYIYTDIDIEVGS